MAEKKKQVSNAGDTTTPAPATNTPDVSNVPTKSPYELAVEAGYTGTEEQFNDPESVMDNPVKQKPVEEPAKPVIEPLFKPGVERQVSNAGKGEVNGDLNLLKIYSEIVDKAAFKGSIDDLENFIKTFNPEIQTGKYIVAKPFKDAAKHLHAGESAKLYAVGEDVSFLDGERLSSLENKGLVTKISE